MSGGDSNRRSLALAIAGLAAVVALFYFDYLRGTAFVWEDALMQFFPGVNYFAVSVAEGRFPLWISGVRNGMPFWSDIQLGAFYPPNWVLPLFVRDGQLSFIAFQWLLVAHVAAAAGFLWLLLRELRLSPVAAVTGAVVFAFSGFMALHIIHVPMIQVMTWLPLLLLVVKRAVERGGLRLHVAAAALMAMMVLAGHPQTALYAFYLVVAWWLWLRAREAGKLSALGLQLVKIAGVGALAVGLAMCAILPAAENTRNSPRSRQTFRHMSDLSLPPYYLLHFFAPNFYGTSRPDNQGAPFWGDDPSSEEVQRVGRGPWEYWEFGAYAGQFALLAALALIFSRRQQNDWSTIRFFLFASAVALWFMLGRYGGLFTALYYIPSGVKMFRGPAKMACVLDLSLAVVAAFAVDAARAGRLRLRWPVTVMAACYGALFLGFLLLGATLHPALRQPATWDFAFRQLCVAGALCAATAGCLYWAQKTKHDAAAWALAGIVFVDLFLAHGAFHRGKTKPTDYYADRFGLLPRLAALEQETGPLRFAQLIGDKIAEEIVFPRNTAYVQKGLEVPEGYTSFYVTDTHNFHQLKNERAKLEIQNIRAGISVNPGVRSVSFFQHTNSLPRALFYSRVRAYETKEQLLAALDAGALDYRNEVGVLAEDARRLLLPAQGNPPVAVRLQRDSPERYVIEYDASAPGVIFVSETFYPGWQANRGGHEIVNVFGAFKGIVVPRAGNGTITVEYRPLTFRMGLLVTGAAVVLLAGLVAWPSKARKA